MRTILQRKCRWLPCWLLACIMTLSATSAWGQGDWKIEKDNSGEYLIKGDTKLRVSIDPQNQVTIKAWYAPEKFELNLSSTAMPTDPNDQTLYTIVGIEQYVFGNCPKLTSVTIPSTVTEIGESAFYLCKNLKEAFINCDLLSVIPKGLFKECSTLEKVTLPESTKEIGPEAFMKNAMLTSITIPSKVTKIGSDAFNGTALTGIDLPSTLQEIGSSAFYGIKTLTSVTIPAQVETLGSEVFYNSGLTSVKFLGNKIEVFSAKAFGQTPLTDITIPDGVKTIKQEAFNFCGELESVTIPGSVTTIEKWAFLDAPKLTKITYLGKTEPDIADQTFDVDYQTPIHPDRKIYLPKGDSSKEWHPEKWGVASVNDLIFSGWEYDSAAKTLSMDKTVINNVTADGKKLTIGDNSALDLSELSLPDSAKDVDP
ncbi:leucine-rich repeat domain-containing protein, partial [Parabacteroides sp.]